MPGNGTCGFSTSSGFIVGGENTIRGEIPFLAALGKFIEFHRFFVISIWFLFVVTKEDSMKNCQL